MALNQSREIASFHELDSLLGDDFVLLCGSAISGGVNNDGVLLRFLPMVGTVSERFFLNLHNHLKNGDYLDRVLSKHARELVSGKYRLKRQARKFEDFLWHLEQVLGEDAVVELLSSLFYCEPGQFLHNHIAVANLLEKGRAGICLTTNFDNAIEVANPNLAKLVHIPGFWIDSIPSDPTLLKLHGDVVEGNYIATIPQLLAAEQTRGFSYLEHLLEDKITLVAGYSGNGDIDIAPHLRKAKEMGARIVWLVRPGYPPSDISTDWFASDLFSLDSDSNCLMKLGGVANQNSLVGSDIFPPWESRLEYWCKTTFSSISTQETISLINLISGWAKFRLYFLNKWDSRKAGASADKDKDSLDFAWKCLGIGTCYSALRAIRKIDRTNIQKLRLYSKLLFIKGFSNWRLVRLMEASNTLRYFSHFEENDQLEEQERSAFRVYVEVLREIIGSYVLKSDARNFYYDHQVDDSCRKLLSIVETSNNPANRMLCRLIVLDIERGIGERTSIDDYRELYQRAVDLQSWGFARTAARSILRINLAEGIHKLRLTHRRAGEAWTWHSMKHNTLAVLDRLPKLLINPAHIANIVLSRIPVLVREVQLGFGWILWKIAYQSSRVKTYCRMKWRSLLRSVARKLANIA